MLEATSNGEKFLLPYTYLKWFLKYLSAVFTHSSSLSRLVSFRCRKSVKFSSTTGRRASMALASMGKLFLAWSTVGLMPKSKWGNLSGKNLKIHS